MRESPRSPLLELTLLRAKEFLREPEAVFWTFAFPVLLALALGFAFREKPPDKLPIAVEAGSGAAETAASLARSEFLSSVVLEREEALAALRRGKVAMIVRVESSQPVFIFDPTRPDAHAARLEAGDALERAAGREDRLKPSIETVREPGARYIDFLMPGLLGLNLMGTGMWGIGFSIVTARSKKLLKRLVATPMRKSHYLFAQILARLLFLTGEVVVLVGFGWLVFGVAVRGSLLVLAVTCLMGAMSFAGIGLLVASRANTIEAVSGWMNLVMLPMWVFSGVFFSSERFPEALQPAIGALPLTAVNQALRAVINEGASLGAVSGQLAILAVWGAVSFAIALWIFRWK
ncbi:MAG: ABC transporter permease [Acidobacteria bacterium]|nr:ABC transporter permease [Acidobacteriota bacterium]